MLTSAWDFLGISAMRGISRAKPGIMVRLRVSAALFMDTSAETVLLSGIGLARLSCRRPSSLTAPMDARLTKGIRA
jgi:hypothetical protein